MRPSQENYYNNLFGEELPWDLIYSSIGTPLTSDTDEKAWLRNIHHKTTHRNNDSRSKHKFCRLGCGCRRESARHFDECPKSQKVRKFVIKLLKSVGTKNHDITLKAWAFGLDSNNKLLNMPSRAILRIWRRFNYAHLTSHELKQSTFNCDVVIKAIAHQWMRNILAYQLSKRTYYYDKINTNVPLFPAACEVVVY